MEQQKIREANNKSVSDSSIKEFEQEANDLPRKSSSAMPMLGG
mgnify:CR=1 FL=1